MKAAVNGKRIHEVMWTTTSRDPGREAEGERVLDHHKAQLIRCHMPESRIKSVIVRCSDRESTGHAVAGCVRVCVCNQS